MVMFLSDVVEKIDGSYYYLDRITSLWDDIDYNNLTKEGDTEFANGKKPIKLIQRLLALSTDPDSIVMDFFAGSGSTGHAVMAQNAADGGNRSFILVQLPEDTHPGSGAFKEGFRDIPALAKERLRRAGESILEEKVQDTWRRDIGFRVLKVDSSNMADTYYAPSETKQSRLPEMVDNIKADRTDHEDLLFQVLVDWGADLTLPIRKENIQGKAVYFVNEAPCDLIACFDKGVTEELVKELAEHGPVRVVFRDNGFESDAVKINVEQIFKQLSHATDVKSI